MRPLAGLMEPEAVLGAMNMVRWNRPPRGREKPEISRHGRRLEVSAIFIRVPTPSANIGTPPNFFHYTAADRRRQHNLDQPLDASLLSCPFLPASWKQKKLRGPRTALREICVKDAGKDGAAALGGVKEIHAGDGGDDQGIALSIIEVEGEGTLIFFVAYYLEVLK